MNIMRLTHDFQPKEIFLDDTRNIRIPFERNWSYHLPVFVCLILSRFIRQITSNLERQRLDDFLKKVESC